MNANEISRLSAICARLASTIEVPVFEDVNTDVVSRKVIEDAWRHTPRALRHVGAMWTDAKDEAASAMLETLTDALQALRIEAYQACRAEYRAWCKANGKEIDETFGLRRWAKANRKTSEACAAYLA